jgi:ribosome-binding protein aMBF1 (putative translation factor)
MKKKVSAGTDNKVYEKMLKKDLSSPKIREEFEHGVALMKLAVQISSERKNRHMSQKQLADKAMMKQQDIARLEKAKHSPTYDTLLKVAHGLGKELHLEFR